MSCVLTSPLPYFDVECECASVQAERPVSAEAQNPRPLLRKKRSRETESEKLNTTCCEVWADLVQDELRTVP